MFGEIGFDKLLMLLVMFLLLFGAKRLPEIGRSLGKGIREFKGSLAGPEDLGEVTRVPDSSVTVQPVLEMQTRAAEAPRRLNG